LLVVEESAGEADVVDPEVVEPVDCAEREIGAAINKKSAALREERCTG
jgi:hypothetical protein